MALAGVHVAFGYCNVNTVGQRQAAALLSNCTASQTMASAGTTSVSAPGGASPDGVVQPICSISASAPIYYATGSSPVADGSDTPNKRRYYDPANGREDLYVNAGDKLAWVLA